MTPVWGRIAWSATQIWERLWLGGRADAEYLTSGNPHCISTVISLSEIPVATKRRDVAYLHIAIADNQSVPIRQFDAIMDALSENIRWGTVLLVCGQGISRAPSMAAAYMDACGYKNLNAALGEIERLRPFINPSRTLVESIRRHLQ